MNVQISSYFVDETVMMDSLDLQGGTVEMVCLEPLDHKDHLGQLTDLQDQLGHKGYRAYEDQEVLLDNEDPGVGVCFTQGGGRVPVQALLEQSWSMLEELVGVIFHMQEQQTTCACHWILNTLCNIAVEFKHITMCMEPNINFLLGDHMIIMYPVLSALSLLDYSS